MKPRVRMNLKDRYYIRLESFGIVDGRQIMCHVYLHKKDKFMSVNVRDDENALKDFYNKIKLFWDKQ